jgi:argininosuccinate lyase
MDKLLNEKKAVDPFGRVGGRKNWSIMDYERKEHFLKTIYKQIPLFVKVHQVWLLMLVRQEIVEEERAGKIMKALEGINEEAIEEMVKKWNPASWEQLVQLEQYLTSKLGQITSDVNIARTIPPPFPGWSFCPFFWR